MFTKAFWRDLAERTCSTVAENAVSVIAIAGTGLLDTNWKGVLSSAAMAGVLTILKGIAASRVGDPFSASLLGHGRHEAIRR